MKLVALFETPDDPQTFDEAYFGTHIPLMEQVDGLRKIVLSRVTRTYMGHDLYLMAEMFFDDVDSLKAAMRSPEMAAAGENLNSFAEGRVTLLSAEEQ